MSDKCETCKGCGFYGDMGPGIAGNTEWQECECLEADDPQRLKAALKTALATLDSTITNRDQAQARYDALRITSETTIGQLRQKIEYLEGRAKELEESQDDAESIMGCLAMQARFFQRDMPLTTPVLQHDNMTGSNADHRGSSRRKSHRD